MQSAPATTSRSRPWKLLAFVTLVVVAIAVPVAPPVVSAVTGQPIPGVGLAHPVGYVLLAPLCTLLDALTALSVSQHVALLSIALGLFVTWRLLRLRSRKRRGSVVVALLWEVGALVLYLGATVAVYAVCALVPRPMARLHLDDPDLVSVDFHSHTLSSHDGRRGFTAEWNRAWHRDAGFDVAYITDHDSTRAALDAEERNPRRAGDGTVLLAGREVVYRGMHVTVIGTYDPRTRTSPSDPCGAWPVVIGTIPANLSRVPVPDCPDKGGGLAAIELLDGAPRGLQQGDRDRERILALADSLDLAVVAASDNHGWGSAAVGWSLMRIPGWRDMTPEDLNDAIIRTIRIQGRNAVQVVGLRRSPDERSSVWGTVASLFLPHNPVTRLGRPERLSWLIWIGLVVSLSGALRRRSVAG